MWQSPVGLPSCMVKDAPGPVGRRQLCPCSSSLPWLVSTCCVYDQRAPYDLRLGVPPLYQHCYRGVGGTEWHMTYNGQADH